MGATGRSADDLVFWRNCAAAVFVVLIAGTSVAAVFGALPMLNYVGPALTGLSGFVALGLLVAERRVRQRGKWTSDDVAVAVGGASGLGIDGSARVDDACVVYVSHVAEDDEWRRKLQVLLPAELERQLGRQVVLWSDVRRRAVKPDWYPKLERMIARADAALMLVSPALVASRFVMDAELSVLRGRGIPLAFVPVRATRGRELDALDGVWWAHDRRRPLATLSEQRATNAIVQIARCVAEVLPERASQDAHTFTDSGLARGSRRVPGLQPARRSGKLHDVPPQVAGEIERDELAGLGDALIAAGRGTVGITGRAIGLHGQGGIGKTVLAAALARDPRTLVTSLVLV